MVVTGQYYEAKWWTSNNVPGDDWGAWESIGSSCDPGQESHDTEESVEEESIEEESEEEESNGNNVWEHEGPHEPPSLNEALKREEELTDSDLFNMVKTSISTLDSAQVDQISPGRPGNPANVRRVESIMSSSQWDYLFAVRDKAYTYRRFLQAVGKFPSVCGDYNDGRNAEDICRRTLATMFAHFTQVNTLI